MLAISLLLRILQYIIIILHSSRVEFSLVRPKHRPLGSLYGCFAEHLEQARAFREANGNQIFA
jgi:hypothetical protein